MHSVNALCSHNLDLRPIGSTDPAHSISYSGLLVLARELSAVLVKMVLRFAHPRRASSEPCIPGNH
jgi:hypothetical protein